MMKLLSSLLSACRHSNADVSRIAPSALDNFLLALVNALVEGQQAGEEKRGDGAEVDSKAAMKAAVVGAAAATGSAPSPADARRMFSLLLHTFRKKLEV